MALSSCANYSSVSPDGTRFRGTYVGTDITGLNHTTRGITMTSMNNSNFGNKVLDTVNKMWSSYMLKEGLTFIAGRYYNYLGKQVDASTTTQLERLRNARSAQESADALKALEIQQKAVTAA